MFFPTACRSFQHHALVVVRRHHRGASGCCDGARRRHGCRRLGRTSIIHHQCEQRSVQRGLSKISTTTTTRTTTRLWDGAPPNNNNRQLSSSSSSSSQTTATLDWERFEFSDSPKIDQRFDVDNQSSYDLFHHNHHHQDDLETMGKKEAVQDVQAAAALNRKQTAWDELEPETVQAAIQALEPFCQAPRVQRIRQVLNQRTRHVRFLFENPANPSNVWACLRTMDSFGIQHVDIVVNSDLYQGKMALTQKRGMRTAMGSAQWLTIRNHLSTAEAVRYLKQVEGCRILASDLSPTSMDIREIDWSSSWKNRNDNSRGNSDPNKDDNNNNDDDDKDDDDRPIVIVMGNEERGISDEMRQLADATFTLPMVGFAESFNLSVATAITLAHLSAASSSNNSNKSGPLRPGDLPPAEYNCLLLRGLLHSISQKRIIPVVLRQAGIELPPELL